MNPYRIEPGSPGSSSGAAALRTLTGDCRETLPTLAPESVDCVITSPPYWKQRDYGHDGQIGQEATPEGYIKALVGVFRLVRPVLKRTGIVFLNIGDVYLRKDLLLLPSRVALAMQADGWILRAEIVWGKLNPLPEPVTDRPSLAHEKIWMLTRSRRHFYANDRAVLPLQHSTYARGARGFGRRSNRLHQDGPPRREGGRYDAGEHHRTTRRIRNYEPAPLPVWRFVPSRYSGAHFATFPPALVERCLACGCPDGGTVLDCFAGAGTTGLVAARLGYEAVLCEVNPAYVDLSIGRIEADRGGDDWRERKAREAAGQCRLL